MNAALITLRAPLAHERTTACNGCNAPATHHVLEVGTQHERGSSATQYRMCDACMRLLKIAVIEHTMVPAYRASDMAGAGGDNDA